ncbi:centriolin isoform X2 [Girardinichthys multiradiatus]|uniref:centriolin isoform X2 n=1 Tax=Girardinichthys multiradiatus TaxID=208333 RepID=UPI001FADBAFB|nr:centriolin isoform X2 [Girardinichthys multiradiatus]
MRVQLLSAMSRKDSELEGRLDNLLSRIAMETQEIKELEQQLTSGQILANEALQKDLEEVICGLQEYLRGMRQQAWRSQLQVHVLQTENQSLQRLLEDAQRHCRQLHDTQEELSALWMEAQALRDRQVELKEGLQQLKEELTQQDGNQRLQVQLDQSKSQLNQTETQLERFTVGLSELQENQRAPKDKVSPKDLLFGSIEQLEKSAQGNLASRQELQQGQNQTVEQDSDWELKEELQRLRDHLLRSHSRTGLVQLNLAPSLAPQGTQDSGLGLQYLSSPDRGQQQDVLPAGGESVSGGEIPPTPPNPSEGVSAGISEAQGPLVGLSWLLCGPPTGGTAQCCGIQHHRDKGSRCVSGCVHKVEAKKLQRSLRRRRSVLQVCDELECLEETLLQRRAELRQADRLLLEAQSCRQTARRTADRMQHRLEDSATCLLEATQHLRKLQEEAEQLRRKREVEEKPRSRQKELHRLGSKICRHPRRPADLLSDCQGAQEHLDPLTCQEEQRLVLKKEELQAAEDRVMKLREEEQRLLSIIKDLFEQQEALFIERRSTGSSVKEEEQRLIRVKAELTSHQTELKQILLEVMVEQEVMEEVKTKCSQTLQQLQKMRENFNKMKGEVDDKRKELAELQQEVASYKEDAASSLKDMRRQRAALQEVQHELSRRKEERSTLQEQCRYLEARRRHTDRCLSVMEVELSKKEGGATSHPNL